MVTVPDSLMVLTFRMELFICRPKVGAWDKTAWRPLPGLQPKIANSSYKLIPAILLLVDWRICRFDYAVDGGWSAWSSWTECSVTCDYGVQTRLRTCTNPVPEFNGAPCQGNGTASKACFSQCPGTHHQTQVYKALSVLAWLSGYDVGLLLADFPWSMPS